jgi:hypothetical protein
MPVIPSDSAWQRIRRAVRLVETDLEQPAGTTRRRPFSESRPLRVILLDDCLDETPTAAAITTAIDTTEIQRLAIVGTPTGGTFTCTFRGQTTPELGWDITGASLEMALQQLPTIGRDAVAVTLGTTVAHRPAVWLIEFTGKLEGEDVPLLEIADNLEGAALTIAATTVWADTGRETLVRNGIPVGNPTPLRAGAVCLCLRHSGTAGYVIHAAEARQFSPYGYAP